MSRAVWLDRVAEGGSLALLLAGEATLLFIVAFVAKEAWPAIVTVDPAEFLWRDPWSPLSDPPRFGIFHAWVSTLVVAGLAMAIALPLGLGIGVFAAEVAPRPMRAVLQPCLELLAGIPSVVYGFFGAVTLVKAFERGFGMPAGECLLAAGLILAVMTLPFIASTTSEAFRAVPSELREAPAALGVTRWRIVSRVLVPRALPGLFAAAALGLARALGETLAVLMLAGNSVAVPRSLLDRGQPITALVATELGEAGAGSPKYHALYASGLVLMAVVGALNAVLWSLRRRLIHDA